MNLSQQQQTSRSVTKVPRGRARIPRQATFEDVSRSWPAGWTRLKAKKLSCWMSNWKVWIPTCGNVQFSPGETEEWNNRASTFHERYTIVIIITSFQHCYLPHILYELAFISEIFCWVDSCVFPSPFWRFFLFIFFMAILWLKSFQLLKFNYVQLTVRSKMLSKLYRNLACLLPHGIM